MSRHPQRPVGSSTTSSSSSSSRARNVGGANLSPLSTAASQPRSSVMTRSLFQNQSQNVLLACLMIACIGLAFWIRRRAWRKSQQEAEKLKAHQGPKKNKGDKRTHTAAAASSSSSSSSLPPLNKVAKIRPPLDPNLRMPEVVIIGGGLAGLSCALSLQKEGIPVTVYERDESLAARRQGFGLTLTNSPVGALATLGVLDTCIREDCLSVAHWVLKPDGQILGYYGRGLKDFDPNIRETASLRIPREDLRRMLYERLKPGTVQWGYKLKDYVEDLKATGSPVKVIFEDGREVSCDMLVGADGINSIVRKLRDTKEKNSNSELRYLSVCVILGISPATHPLLDERGIYVVDGSNRLFTMPFRSAVRNADGTILKPPQTMWQLSFAYPDETEAQQLRTASPQELIEFALKRTQSWIDPVASLISATPSEEVWSTPLYDRDALRLRTVHRPSLITVAGDAAHPMSMFKGQGANQALQDGPTLAAWIRHQHSNRRDTAASAAPGMTRASLLTRIRSYESEVVSRSTPKVLDSRQASAWYHSPRACEIGANYGLGHVGLRPGEVTVVEVLNELLVRGITASNVSPQELEYRVKEVLRDLEAKEIVTAANIRRRQIPKTTTTTTTPTTAIDSPTVAASSSSSAM